MANTFIQLNDTPSEYTGQDGKFLRVKAGGGVSFAPADLNTLTDVEASGAYAPVGGQVLSWSAGAGEWRPLDNDPYSAGNGLSKTGATLQVIATGGLVSNASGVYIADIAGVAGTHGSANTVPQITVNSKGQVTGVSDVPLVADSAQTITGDYVANIQGTTGQIRLVGESGNAANVTIDLTATGVTAATYGNATHFPQITVDSYGRVQNIDLVEIIGGGSNGGNSNVAPGVSAEDAYNMHKYFKTIRVGGVRNENNEVYGVDISAEKPQDILYFESSHQGLGLAPNSNGDSLTFDISPSKIAQDISIADLADVDYSNIVDDGILTWDAVSGQFVADTLEDKISISGLTDVDSTGVLDGGILVWDAASGQFVAGSIADDPSIIGLDDFSVVEQASLNGGKLTYNNNGTLFFSPADLTPFATIQSLDDANADMKSYVDGKISVVTADVNDQVLSYDAATALLSISDGNTVLLSSLNQTLSLTGTLLSISEGNSIDLASFAGSGGGSGNGYSNVNLQAYLDANGYSTTDNDNQTLTLAGNQLTISGGNAVDLSSLTVDLTGYATEAYVDSEVTTANSAMLFHVNLGLDNVATQLNITASNLGTDIASANTAMKTYVDLADGVLSSSITTANSELKAYVDLADGNLVSDIATANSEMKVYVDDTETAIRADLGTDIATANSELKAYVDNRGYATEVYVDTAVQNVIDGANINLDTLAEVSNALGNSNASLSSVAFTGDYNDLNNTPGAISLSGSDLTYDGTTLDLSSVGAVGPQGPQGPQGTTGDTGPQGPQGNIGLTGATGPQGVQGATGADGADGVYVSSAYIGGATGTHLILTLSNTTVIDAGHAAGADGPKGDDGDQGPQGLKGDDGDAGATGATGPTGPAGPVGAQGPQGPQGDDGVSVTNAQITNGDIVLTYSNTSVQNLGDITGPQGPQGLKGDAGDTGAQGPSGLSVVGAIISTNDLVVTLSDSSTINAGNVRGPQGPTGSIGPKGDKGDDGAAGATGDTGPQGPAGSNGSNGAAGAAGPTGTAGPAGTGINNAVVSGAGNLILTMSDASTIDAGNIRGADGDAASLSGYATESYVNNAISNITDSDSQVLALTGNILSISHGNSVDLTSFGGGSGGIADLSSNVLSDLGDVSSTAPSNGQVLKWNGSSWAPASDNAGSGGNGGVGNVSGASIERFKINYASNGSLNSISDTTSGIAGVTINSTTGGEVTVEFTGFNLPPGSIMFYGYDYSNNKYTIVPMETSMGFREIDGGGSSGSPTLFNGTNTLEVKLRLREAETGASRGGFGTTTHAWAQFVMYD